VNASSEQASSWRIRTYPVVILVTLAFALLFATIRYDVDDPASRLGGDYPSFYAAGSIVADGDWQDLYDPVRQQTEQVGLIDNEGGYLYFSYPPFVAAVYGLLARAGYQWSFLLNTLLMMLALGGAVTALRPWLHACGLPFPAVLVIALAFQPVLTAVAGGQNTAISILLFAIAARLDHDERPFLAGLVAALLLFKPQYGVVVLPLFVVARRWRMLAGWAVGAVTLYAMSTILMGGGWVTRWWDQAAGFRDLNATANGANFISLPGFLENMLGVGSVPAFWIGYGLAFVIAGAVAWEWWRLSAGRSLWRWALAAAAAVAVAPQTLFYDAGLLLLLVVAIWPRWHRPALVVAVLAALSWAQVAAPALGWSPLGPIALLGVAAALVTSQTWWLEASQR
jgi:hypothetical protein